MRQAGRESEGSWPIRLDPGTTELEQEAQENEKGVVEKMEEKNPDERISRRGAFRDLKNDRMSRRGAFQDPKIQICVVQAYICSR